MATELEVTKIMAYMSVYYPNFIFKATTDDMPGTAKAYAMELKDIPADALQAAARTLVTTSKWFPSLAELRQTALDIMLNKRGLPSAMEAWEELIRMGDGSPLKGLEEVEPGKFAVIREERTWKYPLVEKVARRCGWPNFPNTDPDQISYDRTVFIKAYESELAREQEKIRMLPEVKNVENEYVKKQLTAGVKSLAEGKCM